ncbi:hypothetical protein K469DRAFT_607634 [Zopfia rhizophila CBS 207.26]|uniref:CRIB domain-containing protein n=1 Tax=Zopfia rhizophila CBS 207.26 TaxID=1314779 RepID=A0A6A6DAZ3_9PEZI|nr:hypothetical protein K469DRAFT_607634 [Zopfia rhizophila CBS 207.26]
MFLFNKNNAVQHSRQSSIDSLVTVPSTSASTSDAWVSQCSDASCFGEMPSPEQQERTHPTKRNSVFNLRSRSNTATSTASSFMSLTSGMTGTESPSHRSSQDLRHFAGQSLLELPGAKRSLFARGKKQKRQSGRISPGYGAYEREEVDVGNKRASVLRKGRRGIHLAESPTHLLKHRISSPFDFQHLAHTDRHQFAALQQASENGLIAEFRAARASQVPRRDLHGIKADNLHFQNFSSENLANPELRSASVLGPRSPPLSPEPIEWQQPDSPGQESTGKALRLTRSVESFSQPVVKTRSHRHTQSANAPPRATSRLQLARIDDMPEESSARLKHPAPARPQSNRNSGMWDKFVSLSPPTTGEMLPPIMDEPDNVGHAVTTPDDSAIHTITLPFSPDLKNVPEEPERFFNPRPAPSPPVRSPKSPKSPAFESYSFRSSQRSPISRSQTRVSPFTSPKSLSQRNSMTRPISQMSDTLGSPTFTRRRSVRRSPTVRRKSNTWRAIDESWEDDVDYIYENALEADCDLDWDHTSDDIMEDRDRTPEQEQHDRPSTAVSESTQTASIESEDESALQTRFFPGAFRPSLLVPSPNAVPELESRSAISASTADTGLQTPSDFFSSASGRSYAPAPYTEADGFSLTPSLLVPPDFKEQVSREEMYDDLLADYEGSDRHFPLLDASQSVASSSRSSRVRSSKRSSYDSSLMSSGQGSGSWSAGVRRSASSSGSLPELVHSRRARKNFDMMVDQLTEQVASFASFSEDTEVNEDDDITPPGRPSQDRTFFASDEEDHQNHDDGHHESIEGEVRASLELARQGPTRSVNRPVHYHKYASSDGIARLLASPIPKTPELQQPPKTRNRAASNTVRGNKRAYLSLFPTPPKHMPLSPGPLSAPLDSSTNKF